MKKVFFGAVTLLIACINWKSATAQRNPSIARDQSLKYERLMHMIDAMYVDLKKLTEELIVKTLAKLDPYSTYISKEEMTQANEQLNGEYCGVGFQISKLNDTLVILPVSEDGPAKKAGVQTGDKILTIDGENTTGSTSMSKRCASV